MCGWRPDFSRSSIQAGGEPTASGAPRALSQNVRILLGRPPNVSPGQFPMGAGGVPLGPISTLTPRGSGMVLFDARRHLATDVPAFTRGLGTRSHLRTGTLRSRRCATVFPRLGNPPHLVCRLGRSSPKPSPAEPGLAGSIRPAPQDSAIGLPGTWAGGGSGDTRMVHRVAPSAGERKSPSVPRLAGSPRSRCLASCSCRLPALADGLPSPASAR
jgi:hypothetical protein